MRWLICALGVVLAICGVVSIVMGYPYIRMEFGWTEVIAGTTALSGGLVTFALGAVLFALDALGDGVAVGKAATRPSESTRVTMRNVALDADEVLDSPVVEERPPNLATSNEARRARRPQPRLDPTPTQAPTVSVDTRPNPKPAAPAPVSVEEERSEAGTWTPMTAAAVPTVLGRYEAGGASYALFSDGTIEVESDGGTQRFESMQHLRAHIGTEQGTS